MHKYEEIQGKKSVEQLDYVLAGHPQPKIQSDHLLPVHLKQSQII